MKINSKMLSIPPYISTSWENVISLQLEESTGNLVISLKTGGTISLPHLSGKAVEEIFNAHSEFVENQTKSPQPLQKTQSGMSFSLTPGRMNLDPFRPIMQHDAGQKDSPDLPKEVVEKVSNVAKALGVDLEAFHLPESEPHCNCPYCQIARAIQGKPKLPAEEIKEELISDTELQFREWDIKQLEKQLYNVTNPLDATEQYQVFLGTPLGCTCGKANCEHIRAVLNS